MREARLPGATRAGDGDEAMGVEQRRQLVRLVGTTDERREPRRQIPALVFADLGEVRVEIGVRELGDLDRFGEALEVMAAERDERSPCWQVGGEGDHLRCRQDLASRSQVANAGRRDDRWADVVLGPTQSDLAGVETHPDADRRGGGPSLFGQPPLGVEGGRNRVARSCEGGDNAVALALLLGSHAVVGGDRLVEDLVAPCRSEGHRIGVVVPEVGRSFDVGEQERGRPRGDHRPTGGRRRRLGGPAGDGPFERDELRSGLGAHVVDESSAVVVVGTERFGLPTITAQGAHQAGAGAISIRMLRGERGGSGDRFRNLACVGQALDEVLLRAEAQLVEPGGLGLGPRLIGELLVRVAAPSLE